ncbi:flagellar hook-associated protein FlgK [Limnohabitans sp. TS-CS-82]|uniref:flagellar hook-associated protein FlgK n=1 Tax=Limnohabitans sp. TS-CS-82 TaxID=2094193 RepID=UPI000CF2C84C|nr:flagellar hook-associated protein FlgK [Limnohabitans sp. TS-CS-82]PQA84648.1 flagellar hook-associated protein FlgK [Limnohabitans sp. TS-CS-82]
MSDMLGISSNAIGAYQRALSTVANNISNVNTEGYSRQDVVLKDSAPKKLASMYVGTGVILQNIKRQYDAFAESNLRNSTSDLASQKPMVDYAKRVMDIMGDKSIGLSSAFDDFFAAAGALSADPASTVQRTSFLRSADGVASRFGELNTQLELIATETRQGVESVAAQINTLTSQLALINQSMTKSPTLESQPAELLDRRDLTLRQLSDLVRVKTSFTTNGTVNVSLGTTMTQGLVVNGNKSRPIGVDTSTVGKIELVLDPYGKTESLASASGGQLGGYQSFISQVLEPAQKNLSALAQTFVSETNTIQKNGIDGYGQMGADLFAFDPSVTTPAAAIRLAVNDGMRVATAAQFRVGEGNTNITTTRATVKFTDTTPATQLSNSQLVNNPNASAGVTFKVDGARVYTPVSTLSAGVKAAFYLDEAEPGQQLQVMTRDGRQLLGQALTETEKFQLFTPDNGFADNANYSDAYLNQTGDKAYRGLDLFYGAKAEVLFGQNFDQFGAAGESLPLAASMETSRISSSDAKIPAGAITVNGLALPAFNANTDSEIIISGISVGTVPTAYNFQAVVGGQLISSLVPSANTGSISQLATALNTSLQAQGLFATAINNNADIRITDSKGRDVGGVALVPTSTASGADSGSVQVRSAAVQVANWINGNSQARVLNPMFGAGANPGFSKFQATLGGVSFELAPTTATNLSSLAAVLQQQFRAKDNSTDISVVVDGTHLLITDAQGRSFKNFALIPADPASLATGGKVEITNSNVSQTNVRAEVFSEVRVPVAQLNLSKPLTINGQSISGYKSVNELVKQINDSQAGVIASVESNGEFVLTDPLGSPIRINATPDGNALDIQPTTYNAQVRMVQVVRDMRIPATDVDFKKPLQINGVNIGEAAYDLPAVHLADYEIKFGSPLQSVSAATPSALETALNANALFAASYEAKVTGDRLVITPMAGDVSDADLDNTFVVKSDSVFLSPQTEIKTLSAFVDRINAKNALTGVVAELDLYGDLKLSTTDEKGTRAISIGPGKDSLGNQAPNALGLDPMDFDVTERLKRKLQDPDFISDIRVSFGSYGDPKTFGDPADLSKMGLRTGAYIEQGSPDELLLFVTGKGAAKIAAGYQGAPDNVRDSLRAQSLNIKFTAENRYTITDAATGTELADRFYDPTVLEPVVEFQGLQIKLSHAPAVGDSYKIDGNFDGLGNNVNMLDMVDLNKKPTANGKTIANTYIDQINNVGNLAQQAIITQEALTVVNEQAVSARDKVSGVNLDDEAAALIRYQQAYQACAKALQISGELFDSIVQIR